MDPTTATPTTAALEELITRCLRRVPDDHAKRYPWLMDIGRRAGEINERLRDEAVAAYEAGRELQGIVYRLSLTAALNATAQTGAFLIWPALAYQIDPYTVDAASYALAVNAIGQILEINVRRERPREEDTAPEVVSAAISLIAGLTADPERVTARLRAVLVEQYRREGRPIPEWLRGPAARAFLDDLTTAGRADRR